MESMGKWMGVFVSMDKMIGKDFEDGVDVFERENGGGEIGMGE
mgnify:CR=1 FL=1